MNIVPEHSGRGVCALQVHPSVSQQVPMHCPYLINQSVRAIRRGIHRRHSLAGVLPPNADDAIEMPPAPFPQRSQVQHPDIILCTGYGHVPGCARQASAQDKVSGRYGEPTDAKRCSAEIAGFREAKQAQFDTIGIDVSQPARAEFSTLHNREFQLGTRRIGYQIIIIIEKSDIFTARVGKPMVSSHVRMALLKRQNPHAWVVPKAG